MIPLGPEFPMKLGVIMKKIEHWPNVKMKLNAVEFFYDFQSNNLINKILLKEIGHRCFLLCLERRNHTFVDSIIELFDGRINFGFRRMVASQNSTNGIPLI